MAVEDHQVSFSLEVNIEPAYENARRLQTVLYRGLGLLQRMGLPENIDAAIMKVQHFIRVLNSLRLMMIAIQALRMAAGDPLAWGMAAVAFGSAVMTTGDFMMEVF